MNKQTDTRKQIELAIKRIQHGKTKRISKERCLSIAAVAEEADISNATIHNRYPDIGDQIRKLVNKNYTNKIKEKHASLKKCEDRLTVLRKELNQLKEDLARSQSINLRLANENELLRANLEAKKGFAFLGFG